MTKSEFENKSLVWIVFVCYAGSMVCGWIGSLVCAPESLAQLILYQIGNALGITASVMAGRYTGLRGQHVAASAYILLGITHGVAMGAISRTTLSVDRGMSMVMPMFPALVFMFWCDLYPKWVRLAGLVPAALFTLVFINVHRGVSYQGWSLNAGYATLQVLEIVWSVYLVKDWQRSRSQRVT
jgi:hypothetical protein